jgi:hypothetical protein
MALVDSLYKEVNDNVILQMQYMGSSCDAALSYMIDVNDVLRGMKEYGLRFPFLSAFA